MNALEHAQRWIQIFGAEDGSRCKERRSKKKAVRLAFLREAAQYGLRRADEEATAHLSRDFRGPDIVRNPVTGRLEDEPWVRPGPGRPINTGSGRSADWCHISYLMYACYARTIHAVLGWSGEDVRQAARVLSRGTDSSKVRRLPDDAIGGLIGRIRAEAKWVERPGVEWTAAWAAGPFDYRPKLEPAAAVEALCWMAFRRLVLQPAWGTWELNRRLEELRLNPEKRASSYLVGEVRRLRGADITDFTGCSGCEYVAALAGRPEVHDFLLSRAAEPKRVEIGGKTAYVVPYGLQAPEGYTHCAVLGLSAEIVCRPGDEYAIVKAYA